jgi:Asp-tRNA(Asn)/Glu-tRNA(Gln) amidotransferase A subunit family amidase
MRSPYGQPHSVYHKDYISGGSSSGNAVSVGANLVSFSIATDTAGSGRVPAALNGVVGYKPTRGLLSTAGLVPACLSLDCIALIAKTVSDARLVWQICEEYDARDRYAKPTLGFERHVNATGPQAKAFKFGIPPPEALSVCTPVYRRMFHEAIKQLQSIGGVLTPIDFSPFENGGRLLYEGTFVSERMASLPDDWLEKNGEHLHPVIRELFEQVAARNSTAVQAYRDLQAKALYTRQAEEVLGYSAKGVDVLIVPTTVTHWTKDQMLADPIKRNSALGVSCLLHVSWSITNMVIGVHPLWQCPRSLRCRRPSGRISNSRPHRQQRRRRETSFRYHLPRFKSHGCRDIRTRQTVSR